MDERKCTRPQDARHKIGSMLWRGRSGRRRGKRKKYVYGFCYIGRGCGSKGKRRVCTFHARHIMEPRGHRQLVVLDMVSTNGRAPRPLLRIVGGGGSGAPHGHG